MFKILCEVSGGVTGHRQGFLKVDGAEQEFETRESAERVAAHLTKSVSPYARAHFNYTVVEDLVLKGYND